ncbi:MAG: hypothetical protein HXX10_13650 [Rhodoplanes sp.]|uniref:hypothetical protein n=1 Tax=Rhodoplanes sp. TaxID=1968906 RepID=UPI0017C93F2B|nr:hypothetical protein [Rhodoplanes sp.]NVO15074.1 hypothetical protein [Rhodoplanes sp.]
MSRTIPGRRRDRWSVVVLLLGAAAALSACSSVLSEMPQQVGGLSPAAPERPAVQPDYPAVNDFPRARTEATPMSEAERKKVQADLDAARATAAKRAGSAAQTQER